MMPAIAELLATSEPLRTFLEALPPNAPAGDCGNPESCVLHEFLLNALGHLYVHAYVSVGKYDVLIGSTADTSIQYDLPAWARAFVAAVDAFGKGCVMTAEKALRVLEMVEAREAVAA